MSAVGIIVNPHAGKDIRRLVSNAGHTSDAVKIGILRRAIAAADDAGVGRILVADDAGGLGRRALGTLSELRADAVEVEGPRTGSHLDTVTAAESMWKQDVGALIVLGGDGTCRDVATGWPDAPLIAISTGTNNVYPSPIDGTSAGTAAALVAGGAVPVDEVSRHSKRLLVRVTHPSFGEIEECALVEVAAIRTPFVGARAVTDPTQVDWVVAAIAEPATTGLSSIAGRIHPLDRETPGGVLIRLGADGRRVRVPLSPGTFDTLAVASVEPVASGATLQLNADGVLAYDGERTTRVPAGADLTVTLSPTGPRLVDVAGTLRRAAAERLFDAEPTKGP